MKVGDRVRVLDPHLDRLDRTWTVTDISGHVDADIDDRRVMVRCGNTHLGLTIDRVEPAKDHR